LLNTYIASQATFCYCNGTVFHIQPANSLGRSPSPRPRTLTCQHTAICSLGLHNPGLPFSGLYSSPCNYIDLYSFAYAGGMEGWGGLVGCSIANSLPHNGYLSMIDQTQIRESLPAKDRRSTHSAMLPTCLITI